MAPTLEDMREGESHGREVEVNYFGGHWHSEPITLGSGGLDSCTAIPKKNLLDHHPDQCTEKRFHQYNDAFWLPKDDDDTVRIRQKLSISYDSGDAF